MLFVFRKHDANIDKSYEKMIKCYILIRNGYNKQNRSLRKCGEVYAFRNDRKIK